MQTMFASYNYAKKKKYSVQMLEGHEEGTLTMAEGRNKCFLLCKGTAGFEDLLRKFGNPFIAAAEWCRGILANNCCEL